MTNNMDKNLFPILALSVVMTSLAPAAVVTFTGGTITKNGGATIVTSGSISEYDVDFYTESGFVLDYIGVGGDGFSSFVGNYYSTGNDVIHGHWGMGMSSIDIYKAGGGTFDLNYFVLTSNTQSGGSPHTGNESVTIEGFLNGVSTGTAFLLPPEDWGFPAIDVFMSTNFDLVDRVKIVGSNSFCYGMDEFYIDQAAPVPEPTAGALLALGLGGLIALRRTRRV
jgi:hypothetical protein